ncbi:MAG: fasciclin domain-containing protein, partial [Bacteroidota bacterium]
MKLLSRFSLLALLLCSLFVFTNCDDDDVVEPAPPAATPSAVELVTTNDDFSTLAAALTRANLVNTLSG